MSARDKIDAFRASKNATGGLQGNSSSVDGSDVVPPKRNSQQKDQDAEKARLEGLKRKEAQEKKERDEREARTQERKQQERQQQDEARRTQERQQREEEEAKRVQERQRREEEAQRAQERQQQERQREEAEEKATHQKSIDELQKKVKELEKNNNEAKLIQTSMKDDFRAKDEELAALEKKLEETERDALECRKAAASALEAASKAKAKFKEAEKEKAALQEEAKKLREAASHTQAAEEERRDAESQLKTLEEKHTELRKKLADLDAKTTRLVGDAEHKAREEARAEAQKEVEEARKKALQEADEKVKAMAELSRKQLEEQRAKRREAEAKFKHLTTEKADLQAQVDNLTQASQSSVSDVKKLNGQLNDEVAVLKADVTELDRQLQNAKIAQQEAKETEEELINMKKEHLSIHEAYRKLQEEHEELQKERAHNNREFDRAHKRKEEEVDELARKVADLERNRGRKDPDHELRQARLEEEIKQLKADIENRKVANESLKKRLEGFEHEYKAPATDLVATRAQVRELMESLNDLRTQTNLNPYKIFLEELSHVILREMKADIPMERRITVFTEKVKEIQMPRRQEPAFEPVNTLVDNMMRNFEAYFQCTLYREEMRAFFRRLDEFESDGKIAPIFTELLPLMEEWDHTKNLVGDFEDKLRRKIVHNVNVLLGEQVPPPPPPPVEHSEENHQCTYKTLYNEQQDRLHALEHLNMELQPLLLQRDMDPDVKAERNDYITCHKIVVLASAFIQAYRSLHEGLSSKAAQLSTRLRTYPMNATPEATYILKEVIIKEAGELVTAFERNVLPLNFVDCLNALVTRVIHGQVRGSMQLEIRDMFQRSYKEAKANLDTEHSKFRINTIEFTQKAWNELAHLPVHDRGIQIVSANLRDLSESLREANTIIQRVRGISISLKDKDGVVIQRKFFTEAEAELNDAEFNTQRVLKSVKAQSMLLNDAVHTQRNLITMFSNLVDPSTRTIDDNRRLADELQRLSDYFDKQEKEMKASRSRVNEEAADLMKQNVHLESDLHLATLMTSSMATCIGRFVSYFSSNEAPQAGSGVMYPVLERVIDGLHKDKDTGKTLKDTCDDINTAILEMSQMVNAFQGTLEISVPSALIKDLRKTMTTAITPESNGVMSTLLKANTQLNLLQNRYTSLKEECARLKPLVGKERIHYDKLITQCALLKEKLHSATSLFRKARQAEATEKVRLMKRMNEMELERKLQQQMRAANMDHMIGTALPVDKKGKGSNKFGFLFPATNTEGHPHNALTTTTTTTTEAQTGPMYRGVADFQVFAAVRYFMVLVAGELQVRPQALIHEQFFNCNEEAALMIEQSLKQTKEFSMQQFFSDTPGGSDLSRAQRKALDDVTEEDEAETDHEEKHVTHKEDEDDNRSIAGSDTSGMTDVNEALQHAKHDLYPTSDRLSMGTENEEYRAPLPMSKAAKNALNALEASSRSAKDFVWALHDILTSSGVKCVMNAWDLLKSAPLYTNKHLLQIMTDDLIRTQFATLCSCFYRTFEYGTPGRNPMLSQRDTINQTQAAVQFFLVQCVGYDAAKQRFYRRRPTNFK